MSSKSLDYTAVKRLLAEQLHVIKLRCNAVRTVLKKALKTQQWSVHETLSTSRRDSIRAINHFLLVVSLSMDVFANLICSSFFSFNNVSTKHSVAPRTRKVVPKLKRSSGKPCFHLSTMYRLRRNQCRLWCKLCEQHCWFWQYWQPEKKGRQTEVK